MKAAAYARYSTTFQKETSIASQLKEIALYCDKNDIDIVDTFIDEAQSGTNTDREAFTRLVAAAKLQRFDAVIIYDISRGSRDVVDWFSFRKEMQTLGVKVFSTTEKLGDISDPNAFITELITVGIGQHQVLQSRQKSIAARAVVVERGKFCGGIPPLGYDIVDGDYVINSREAEAVRLIFKMYASGSSYSRIIDEIDKYGLTGKRGAKISKTALHSILKNDRYIGMYSWNRKHMRYMNKWVGRKPNPNAVEIENGIPAIIDIETWELVRKRMLENKKNKTNKSRVGREYILSGLMVCSKCGSAFVGSTTIKDEYEYKFYTCIGKKRAHICDAKNIAANEIEPLVVQLVKRDLLNGDMIERTADAIMSVVSDNTDNSIDEYKKDLTDTNVKIGNLMRSLETGIDSQAVRDRLAELESRRGILKDRIKEMSASAPVVSRDALIKQLSVDAKRVVEDETCMKEILHKYITKIQVADDQIIIHCVGDLNTVGSPGWV